MKQNFLQKYGHSLEIVDFPEIPLFCHFISLRQLARYIPFKFWQKIRCQKLSEIKRNPFVDH